METSETKNVKSKTTYIYIYTNLHKFTNLPVDVIVRLPHPRSGDSQGQETFLTPSADKQTRNYDIECSYIYIYRQRERERERQRERERERESYIYIYIYFTH